jgi:glycosyltransferase involved in cell wall biosynthesis
MFILSLLIAFWVLIAYLSGNTIAGWTSMLLIITLFSGINMICLGLIGEYVGKIFLEVKQRPRFLIEEETPKL